MALLVKADLSKASLIKDGTYPAAVASVKTFVNTFGDRVGFEFTILGGLYQGETVTRSTAPQLTAKSKLTETISGIIGRELTAEELGEGFDLEGLVDRTCNILVLTNRSKAGTAYSSVERVFPA